MAQCGESVFRRAHTISKLGKEVRHQHPNRGLIVYDEKSFFHAALTNPSGIEAK
jgi:hypothetical protein